MKAVLDTNVFISGIFWEGDSHKVLVSWKEHGFELITSLDILTELIRVMKDFKIRLPEEIIDDWAHLIIKNSMLVDPDEKITLVKSDPADNLLLEAAISGCADYIISQDNPLLSLKQVRGIKILTPGEFARILPE